MFRQAIRHEIRRLFPDPEIQNTVSIQLYKASYPMVGVNIDRVILAILYLSQGRFSALERLIRSAEKDWRDVLTSAGLAFENWPEVLRSRGIYPDEPLVKRLFAWIRRTK